MPVYFFCRVYAYNLFTEKTANFFVFRWPEQLFTLVSHLPASSAIEQIQLCNIPKNILNDICEYLTILTSGREKTGNKNMDHHIGNRNCYAMDIGDMAVILLLLLLLWLLYYSIHTHLYAKQCLSSIKYDISLKLNGGNKTNADKQKAQRQYA